LQQIGSTNIRIKLVGNTKLGNILDMELIVNAGHTAILGKTGSGKTYTAKGIAERLLKDGKRVCILDPTGAWWGLRSNVKGDRPAFPIVVFGGNHADVSLNSGSAQAIAEIIGTTDTSAVLDTRDMSVGERSRFFTDFAESLLRRNKGPLHLIIDEAHVFMPQGRVPDPQSGRMLHAGNNLVSLGRGVGLRIIMITQHPAKLHKDSLTQAESLIALRLIAPQDRRAVEDWIGEWAEPKQGAELLASLPSLPTATGWVWAPELGILKKANFPKINTYDSSKAPDGEQEKIVLARIDLPAIESRLEAVAKDAVDNDPKRLRARIAELEKAKGGKVDQEAIRKAEEAAEVRGKVEGYKEAISALRGVSGKLRVVRSGVDRDRGQHTGFHRRDQKASRRAQGTTRGVPAKPALSAAPPAEGITGRSSAFSMLWRSCRRWGWTVCTRSRSRPLPGYRPAAAPLPITLDGCARWG
jgi:hypothetical protein